MTPKEQQLKEAADAYANFITDNEKDRRTVFHAYKEGIVSDAAREYWQGWADEKPELNKECLLLTATFYKTWEYKLFEIYKVEFDGEWYWAISLDGDEWGDIADLKADKYLVLSQLPKTESK